MLHEWLLSAVPGIALGTPVANIGKQLGAKPFERNDGRHEFELKKLDGASRLVVAEADVSSIDAIVTIPDSKAKPSKPALAELKKQVTAALTEKFGKPDLTIQKNTPHWAVDDQHFVQLVTWSGTNSLGKESHSLKLTLIKRS